MSKFHVGDRVRIHTPEDRKFHNRTGYVLTEPSLSNSLTYIVDVDIATSEGEDTDYEFTENELRPAEIVALAVGKPSGEDGQYQAGDEVKVYPVTEVDWATPDPAPALRAMAVARAVDVVNHPPHYNRFPVEVINITEQLDFNRGNAVKYLARAGFKEGVDELEDLSKAAWYVNRAIEKLTKERENG